MSFAQYEYLPFLGLVLAAFQFVPRALRCAFLLLASFAFYVWWQPWHGLLLAASIALCFGTGLAVARAATEARRRAWFALALTGSLGLLAAFKYGDFLVDNLNAVLVGAGLEGLRRPGLSLPLGLSFYTFQGLGYVIDVRRRQLEPCRDPIRFALYLSFFPQLVAGPIERAGSLLPQLGALEPLGAGNAWLGARRILWGLVKKLVLADRLRALVWPVFLAPGEHDSLSLAVAMISMNAVLYLDFSAYTDIARGSARLFGVELVRNFERPFAARTLGEFAQRWHVSLYTWIRDYAFAPLAGARLSYLSIWRNSLLVMGLFGLWHGAAWSFVLWGLASGATIALQHSVRLARTRAGVRVPARTGWRAGDYASWAFTMGAASLFFVLFFSPSLAFAGEYYERLFALRAPTRAALSGFGAPVALGLAAGLAVHLSGLRVDWEQRWGSMGPLARTLWLALLAGAAVLLRARESMPFIYFQF